MQGLMLHCGAQAATREEIERLPEPTIMGPQHKPIHHAEFLDLIERKLTAAGFDIKEQAYGITDSGRMFGLQTLTTDRVRETPGTSFLFGLRAAYDQSFAASIAAGSRVFVCDNLSISGNFVMKTKQTTYYKDRLPRLVEDSINKLALTFRSQSERFDAYKRRELSPQTADAAILELARTGVTSWSNLGRVVAEWDEPSHEEHAEDGRSVWRFFNATTESLKIRNPEHPTVWSLPERSTRLHALCDRLCDLPLAA
jgi:hypothetical protein